MAKKEMTGEMTAPTNGADSLIAGANKMAGLTRAEQLKVFGEKFGVSSSELEVLAAGKLPFWPAYAGAQLIGTVMNYRVINSKFGDIGAYMVRTEEKCLAGNADGEIFDMGPGELITVLERSVMQNLKNSEGQKVGVLCLGKAQGKENEYWDYVIFRQKKTEKQLPAAQ